MLHLLGTLREPLQTFSRSATFFLELLFTFLTFFLAQPKNVNLYGRKVSAGAVFISPFDPFDRSPFLVIITISIITIKVWALSEAAQSLLDVSLPILSAVADTISSHQRAYEYERAYLASSPQLLSHHRRHNQCAPAIGHCCFLFISHPFFLPSLAPFVFP